MLSPSGGEVERKLEPRGYERSRRSVAIDVKAKRSRTQSGVGFAVLMRVGISCGATCPTVAYLRWRLAINLTCLAPRKRRFSSVHRCYQRCAGKSRKGRILQGRQVSSVTVEYLSIEHTPAFRLLRASIKSRTLQTVGHQSQRGRSIGWKW